MNQPTREEFEDLKEEVRKLRQQTEPMKINSIEFDPGGIQNRLDNLAEMMKEQDHLLTEIYTDVGHAKANIGVIKGQMERAQADILKIRESQADFKDALKEHGQRLDRIETNQGEHTKRFNRLETIMLQILGRLPQQEGE